MKLRISSIIMAGLPFALFGSTLLFDSLGLCLPHPTLYRVSFYLHLAGIVTSFVVAFPSIVAYMYNIPAHSTSKSRASMSFEEVIATMAVCLFMLLFLFRYETAFPPSIFLGLETLALLLLALSNWKRIVFIYHYHVSSTLEGWKNIKQEYRNRRVPMA